MANFLWKVNRLRTMAPAEIIWRLRQATHSCMERYGFGLAHRIPSAQGICGRPWVEVLPTEFDTNLYQKAAERILSGRFDVFALRDLHLGFPPRWNRDPKTGIEAPQQFGKTLDYRNEHTIGDIKYLWETNRHYELVTLAQAFHLTRKDRYAEGCRVLLESWFEQTTYPNGQNWTSSLENAIRLLNWAVAWQLLQGDDSCLFKGTEGQRFRQRWLDSIYRHCYFISGYFSLKSSANNHLLGEYMGLFVAATTWQLWSESDAWRQRSRHGLEQEALKQNASDGVNLEQAIWYQHEVADMLLICGLFGRRNGISFSKAYWRRLEAMLEFILAVMDAGGNVPMIGDSDDAVMVRFSAEQNFQAYRSLLASGAILFKREDFKRKAGRFEDKSRWLLGDAAALQYESLSADQLRPFRRAFPEGGYYLLGNDFESDTEVRIMADAGPLGYLSIAAHGHADALAFSLSVASMPVLIDPGTYAYHTQKQWRDYFRGTAAHNTVRIDGLDQSEPGGNFMWLRKARAYCEEWDSNEVQDFFAGCHDGYLRLPDPVLHKRKILFYKASRTLIVEDFFECQGTHALEFSWHFAATCKVALEHRKITVNCGNTGIEMRMLDCDFLPELTRGQETPPLGWTSHRFDEKCPSPTVVWKGVIHGSKSFVTVFQISIMTAVEEGRSYFPCAEMSFL